MQKWNKKYLEYLKNKYTKLAKEANDLDEAIKYEETLGSLELIASSKRIYIPTKFNYADSVNSDLEVIKSYATYCPILRMFSPIMDEYTISNVKLHKMRITEDSLFKQTGCFYHNTSEELSRAYSFLSKKFNRTFNFNRSRKTTTQNGQTYDVAHTKHCFYNIYVTNTLIDYISMAHEIGHGIDILFNDDIMYDINRKCFSETSSIFLEMINNDFIGTKLNIMNESFLIKVQVLKDYLYSCDLICSKIDMYNELSSNNIYKEKEAKLFYSDLGYNNYGVKDIIHTYINDIFHYVISYLTAVELYLIYLQDKNEAFKLYSLIRDVKGLSSDGYLKYVRSIGIDPGNNINSYINYLINQDKKGEFIYAKKI